MFLENNIKDKILLVKPMNIGISTKLAFSYYLEYKNDINTFRKYAVIRK